MACFELITRTKPQQCPHPEGPAATAAEPPPALLLTRAACCVLCVCQEEHHEALQGQQLAMMRALLEQQVLPETAAVLATADKNAREIPSSGKERVVPKILVPLVKVRARYLSSSSSSVHVSRPGSLRI